MSVDGEIPTLDVAEVVQTLLQGPRVVRSTRYRVEYTDPIYLPQLRLSGERRRESCGSAPTRKATAVARGVS